MARFLIRRLLFFVPGLLLVSMLTFVMVRTAGGDPAALQLGVHASPATQVESNFHGKGVHEAARISALAEGGEILASRETAAGRAGLSEARSVTLKGIAEPIDIVAVDWR